MQEIPVNIPNGVPSILDGAGAIKDIVSADALEEANKHIDEYQEEVAEQPQKMVAVDVNEFYARMRTKPVLRDYKKIGRNDPCPCGAVDENGKPKKYKNCCLASGRFETKHQMGD